MKLFTRKTLVFSADLVDWLGKVLRSLSETLDNPSKE